MERIKRQYEDAVHDYCGNKKQKLFRSVFEDLANEIYYEIFDYLDIYDIYQGFFNLNQRFQNLYFHSNLPIQINISTMTKMKFECYYKKIILPNKHRINYLRLSNPFTTDIVFSSARVITQFLQLETLVLDNIVYKSFKNISTYLTSLPNLYSLSINFIEQLECENVPFGTIFQLCNLRYFKITYRETNEYQPSPIYFTDYGHSSIEYLVINTYFHVESFNNLYILSSKTSLFID